MSKKSSLNTLKLGNLISVKVIEWTSKEYYIIEYQGELLRVCNQSDSPWKTGDTLQLKVIGLAPLTLALPGQTRRFSWGIRV